MQDSLHDIRGTLEDLEALLRERMFPDMPVPPRVVMKDMSVGASSMISSRSSRSNRPREVRSERSTPAGPREGPRIMRAISLSPPPIRVPSPDSLSETMSFLSSHHSDDLSLLESESYPMMDIPASPSWPTSSPISSPDSSTSSSPTSAPPSSITPSVELSDIGLAHLPVPPRVLRTGSRSPTPTPPPLSSSPSPSSVSSGTARPVPSISLTTLRDGLDAIRQQIANMLDGQDDTNRRLDALRNLPRAAEAPPAPEDRWDEFSERLRVIEENLLQLLRRGRAPPPVVEEEASTVDSETRSIFRRIAQIHDASREAPTIQAPIPVHAGPSFDEQLMEIMMSAPPGPAGQVQAPPPLIPLIYRPGPRARPRSASPIFEADVPPRPGTFPITRTVPHIGRQGPTAPSRPPPVRRAPQVPRMAPSGIAPSETESQSQADIPMAGPGPTGVHMRPVSGPDIDFERRVRDQRRQRRPDTDGFFNIQTVCGIL